MALRLRFGVMATPGLVVDGDSGLITKDGGSRFDDFSFRTNDPAFLTGENGEALLAGSKADIVSDDRLGSDELQPVMGAAIQRWSDLLEGEDKERAREEVARHNPRKSYPTIVIDDQVVVVGFDPDKLKEALGI